MPEAQLQAQLESIQQKRNSLQTVIALFKETDKTDVTETVEKTIPTLRGVSEKQPDSVDQNSVVSSTSPDASMSVVPSVPASTKGKKTATSASKKKSTKKTQPSKAVKQAPGWQQYLRCEFRNSSLPQAISSVIHSQSERVWDILAVLDAIFVEEIPQEVKKKVRLQITNLLATGARENKWYRGQQGSYTLSKEAATAKDS